MKWNYIVIYNKHGEIGRSRDSEHYELFSIYKKAKEFYDKLEIEDRSHDFGIFYKNIFKIKEVTIMPIWYLDELLDIINKYFNFNSLSLSDKNSLKKSIDSFLEEFYQEIYDDMDLECEPSFDWSDLD